MKAIQDSPTGSGRIGNLRKRNSPTPSGRIKNWVCAYMGKHKIRDRRNNRLTITQDNIISQIANQEGMSKASVRKVFKSTERYIFDCLSATTPSESTTIRILDGLTLECNYIPEKKIYTYDEFVCKPRFWTKAKLTRYYNQKLNKKR